MGKVKFVMQGGGDKDGGGFRTENQGAEGGGAETGGAGAANFSRAKITLRTDENVKSRGNTLIFCVGDQGGKGASFRLKGADEAGDGRGGIRSGQKGVEGGRLGLSRSSSGGVVLCGLRSCP